MHGEFDSLEIAVSQTLPSTITIRVPLPDDAQAVVDLINICSLAEGGSPDFTLAGLREDWDAPSFDLASDAWLAEGSAGRLLGYEQFFAHPAGPAHAIDGYVHPEHKGRGIGTRLLRLAERRAREQFGPGARLRGSIEATNRAAQQLFAAEGYTCVRHFWRMEIDLDAPPPAAVCPPGIVIRAFVPGQDERATHAAVEAAFQDHWSHTPITFEDWARGQLGRSDFDPALWFLACAGDGVVGTALCFRRTPEFGWVRNVAVVREWRGRGVGLALLRHAFGAFCARGVRSVGLGVDAQNPTGATRLYERAGMHVAERYDTLEKVVV
jgi:mycothiol synthase